jgi:hypothetical protein
MHVCVCVFKTGEKNKMNQASHKQQVKKLENFMHSKTKAENGKISDNAEGTQHFTYLIYFKYFGKCTQIFFEGSTFLSNLLLSFTSNLN